MSLEMSSLTLGLVLGFSPEPSGVQRAEPGVAVAWAQPATLAMWPSVSFVHLCDDRSHCPGGTNGQDS